MPELAGPSGREEYIARLDALYSKGRAVADLVMRQQDIDAELHSRERGLFEERRAFDASGFTGATQSASAFVLLAVGLYTLLITPVTHDIMTALFLLGSALVVLKQDPKHNALGKVALAVGVLFSLIAVTGVVRTLAQVNVVVSAFVVVAMALAALAARVAFRFYVKKNRELVDTANQQIRLANEQEIAYTQSLRAEYESVVSHLAQAQHVFEAEADGWYPPGYLSLEAIASIRSAFVEHRADTMKEAINVVVDDGLKLQMIEGQQALRRQMMVSNLLSIGQIALQAQAVSEARETGARLEAAQRDTAQAVRQHNDTAQKINGQLRNLRRGR